MSEEAGHHERRKYFRVQTFARVSLRLLQRSEDVEAARARLKVRHVPAMTPGTLNDLRMSPEARPVIELLQRIAFTLDRMDRKLDSILQADPARGEPMASQALAIVLSGSGFSGSFKLAAEAGALVETQIDLGETGIPMIPAISRIVKIQRVEGVPDVIAFSFDEILPQDRERIVQFTLRNQSRELRKKHMGESA